MRFILYHKNEDGSLGLKNLDKKTEIELSELYGYRGSFENL